MCKVSSGSVQWDCEQFPQSKSGELGREQQGLRALIILGAHSAPLCLQSRAGLDHLWRSLPAHTIL